MVNGSSWGSFVINGNLKSYNSFSELLFLIIFWNKISREKPSRPLKVSNVHMVPHDLRNGHTIMLDAIQLCHYNQGQNCPKKGLSDPQKEKK